ncbi:hypothetical protein KFE25_010537 [Diacronema lutheri]|uniref:Uncharacterized protein n=2 Tax=Diacronema lutheri TaxID=2081491 RepID=A0A8J5XLV0_DIALT|nr:hypothetical protein KFE25_010537 [Diacronema lutheri]
MPDEKPTLPGEDGAPNVLLVAGTAAEQLASELERTGGAFSPPGDGARDTIWHVWTKYYSADVHVRVLPAREPHEADALLRARGALMLAFDVCAPCDAADGPSARARAEWARLLSEREARGEGVETIVCVGFEPTSAADGEARAARRASAAAEMARLSAWSLGVGAESVPLVQGEPVHMRAREKCGVARIAEIVECHAWAETHTPQRPPPAQWRCSPAGAPRAAAAPEPPSEPALDFSDAACYQLHASGTLGECAGGDDGRGAHLPADAAADAAASAAAGEFSALRDLATRPRVRAALAQARAAFLPSVVERASAEAAAAELRALHAAATRPRTRDALFVLLAQVEAGAKASAEAMADAGVGTHAGRAGGRDPEARAVQQVIGRHDASDVDEREAEARLQQLMASARTQRGGAGGDDDDGDGDGNGDGDGDGDSGLERLMGRMAQLRQHGHGLDSAARRERAAELALEAARLCGFADGEGGSSSDEACDAP